MITEPEIIAALERVWAEQPDGLHGVALFVSQSVPEHYRIDVWTERRENVLRRAHGEDRRDEVVRVVTRRSIKHLFFDASDAEELASRAGHVEGLVRLGHALLDDMAAGCPKHEQHAAVDRNDIPRIASGWTRLYHRGES